jgi:hypothetical protein
MIAMKSRRAMSLGETADEFHMLIGYCIATWAQADDELFRIFQNCLAAPLEQSAIVYYRAPGLDVRLGITDELVKSRLPKPARKSGGHPHRSVRSWTEVTGQFRTLLSTRRRIAHQPTGPRFESFRVGESHVGEPPPSWFEIYVGEYERLRSGEKPPLKVQDLSEHLKAVIYLRDALRTFFYKELIRPTLPKAS